MITPNTHSAFIEFSDGSRAFIDGIPDTCEHKEEDELFQSASGKWIHWYTYRQWAHLCSDARGRLIHEHHNTIDDPIVLGTSECRKCKRIYSPPMF